MGGGWHPSSVHRLGGAANHAWVRTSLVVVVTGRRRHWPSWASLSTALLGRPWGRVLPDLFVHLHVHTEYSMLDGAAKISSLFAEAQRLEMPAVAMTDHGNMYGAAEFYRQSQRSSVKPIIGIEAYLAPASRHHKKPVFWGQANQRGSDEYGEGGDVSGAGAYTHMTMLAANATGLRNLFKLSSLASFEGYYRKPRMDRDLISEHAQGIIATT